MQVVGKILEPFFLNPLRDIYYDCKLVLGKSDRSNKEAAKRINKESLKIISKESTIRDEATDKNKRDKAVVNIRNEIEKKVMNNKEDGKEINRIKEEAKKRICENISRIILTLLLFAGNSKIYAYTKSSNIMNTIIPLGIFIISPSSSILLWAVFFISRAINAVASRCLANLGAALFSAIFSGFLLENYTYFYKKSYLGVPEKLIMDNICVPILMHPLDKILDILQSP